MLLRLDDDTLQLLENWELFVRRINLRITLLLACQKADFLKFFELTLDITRIFFNKLRKTANMRAKVWVLCVHHYNLSPNS